MTLSIFYLKKLRMEDYKITKYGQLLEHTKMNQCTWLVNGVAAL
jgi:hypothetical protein